MSATRYGDILSPELGFLPVLVTNLPPLAGVLWFGWNPETLAAVYALELLVLFPLAGVKALFAGQPPISDRESGVFSVSESDLVDKRGSVTVHDRLPPIHPRTVPFATAVVSGGAWISLLVVAPLSEAVPLAEVLRRPEVLTSVAALAVGQLVETGYTYIGSGQHADHSPYAVVEIPARQGFFVAFLLFVVAAGGATFALAGFVFVKVLFEWSGFRAKCGGGGRFASWLSGPDSDSTVDSLDVPDGPPSATVDVDRRAVAAAAVWRAVTTTGPFYVTLTTILWVGLTAFLTAGRAASMILWVGTGVSALLLFTLMVAGDIAEDILTSGWLTYRRTGDRLVAHDRLTGEPQWVTPVSELRDAAVVDTRSTDRYLGTRTFTVTTGWGDDESERTLGPVRHPETLAETFELPIESTDLPPLDRRLATAAVASVALTVAVTAVAAATPLGSPVSWLHALFLLPFLTLIPKGLWRLAHP